MAHFHSLILYFTMHGHKAAIGRVKIKSRENKCHAQKLHRRDAFMQKDPRRKHRDRADAVKKRRRASRANAVNGMLLQKIPDTGAQNAKVENRNRGGLLHVG